MQDQAGQNQIDQIREIVFGSHLQSIEKKFQQIESQFATDFSKINQDLKKQGDSFQNNLDLGVDNLSKKINLSDVEIKKIKKDLESQMNKVNEDLVERMDMRLQNLTDSLSQGRKDLENIKKNMEQLNDQLRSEFMQMLSKEVIRLESINVSKSQLAEDFLSLGMKISGVQNIANGETIFREKN